MHIQRWFENCNFSRLPFVSISSLSRSLSFNLFSSFQFTGLFLAASLVFSLPGVTVAQTTVRAQIVTVAAQQKTVIASTTPSKSESSKAPARRTGVASATLHTRVARSRSRHTPATRTVQKQIRPTSERYSEIQAALGKNGYFEGTPDGIWGQNSVDALSRFQQDHSLESTGKVDAKTLILLGLGPKYDDSAPTEAAAPAPQQ